MVQRYLPEIVQGDKRVLVISGEPVPYSARAHPRRAGEIRGNMPCRRQGRGPAAERARRRDRRIARPHPRGARPAARGPRRDRRQPHRDQRHEPHPLPGDHAAERLRRGGDVHRRAGSGLARRRPDRRAFPAGRGCASATIGSPASRSIPMAVLSLSNAHLAFGHVPLLDGANFSLETGDRVGLIGRNGTGKSSMLKILAGIEKLDDGLLQLTQGLTQRLRAAGARAARPGRTIVRRRSAKASPKRRPLRERYEDHARERRPRRAADAHRGDRRLELGAARRRPRSHRLHLDGGRNDRRTVRRA